ncbi:kinesin-like protein CG14535 [Pollicipes pollicipes]|uniref:kinesin-like protein CG14535 n=1 Tax=Pollicipes pollicipes TaxID=41117 RepID=UPI001885607E|nr:kinesin-like protein CG14535 [Pollicipes pollicipes]
MAANNRLDHVMQIVQHDTRAAQMRLSSPHKKRRHRDTEEEPTSGFSAALRREPPPLPAALQRRLGTPQESTGLGKVRVLLRVRQAQPSSHFSVDPRRKQVTLVDPSAAAGTVAPESRRLGVAAPKMFAFDGVYDCDDPQTEISTSALVDVVHAVINGNDGCVLCLGQSKTGKTTTMLGGSGSADQLGIIPCAISWLYRGIGEQKQKSGARFSVRVSAVQIAGAAENLRDLLKDHAKDSDQSPGVYLREDPVLGSQLLNQSEIRAETAEKAALYLDSAAAARAASEDGGRSSHLLYTLHVFQYSVKSDKSSGVTGGRSRLHLFDLGGFEKTKVSGLTLSAVGNVIVSIFNAHKHLPCRDSKLVHLFREAMGSLTCQTTIVAHVSTDAALYAETLTTVQLASRIHRMRRRRIKPHGSSGSGGSAEENRQARLRSSGEESSGRSSSDVDPSSSEQSADTVIYLGPGADECTDGEHPPVYIPSLTSDNRAAMSKALKGSSAEGGKCRSPARTHSSSSTPTHRPAATAAAPFSPQHRTLDKLTGAVPKSPQVKRKGHEARHAAGPEKVAPAGATPQEQWIDGPRFSRSRIAEAQKIKTRQETWIDGPSGGARAPATASLTPAAAAAAGAIPKTGRPAAGRAAPPPIQGYGFMDDHKKSMITRWVEHQIEAVSTKKRTKSEETAHRAGQYKELTQFKTQDDEPVEAKIMTQFKTQDSSGESSPLPERHARPAAARKGSPEASSTLPRPKTRGSSAEKESSPPLAAEKPKVAPIPSDVTPPAPSIGLEATPSLDEICAQCEQLVDVLTQENDVKRPPAGRKVSPPDGRSSAPPEGREMADAAQNTEDADSLAEDCSEPGRQPSSSSSSDVARGEIIEVEERDEPVPMTDSCLQVTEEDIARCMGIITKPLLLPPPDLDENGHPLRALSEENLTYASSFSDMYTLRGGSDCEPLYDEPGLGANPLSTLEIPDYGKLCDDLSLTNQRLDGISRLHDFYRDLASQPPPPPQPTPLISELLFGGDRSETNSVCSEPVRPVACQHCKTLKKTDSLRHGNYVKSIKDWLALLPDLESEAEEYICDNCRRKQNEELDQLGDDFEIQSDITPYLPTFSNLSSLRHPDGASNPNLSKHASLVLDEELSLPPPPQPPVVAPPAHLDERLPGNGASGSDEDTSSGAARQLKGLTEAVVMVAGRVDPAPPPETVPQELDERQVAGRPRSRAEQLSPVKTKGSKLGRLFGKGRSVSRSPSKLAKGRYVSAEVTGSICSPRYPERGLKKDKKAEKKATEERKSKSKERKPRSDSASSGADVAKPRLDRSASLVQPRTARAEKALRCVEEQPDWARSIKREKYNFTCDTTLPAFLPNVSSGYDSGNDSGIGLRKSQKKRKAAESSGYESVLPPSECSSLESSQESEEEPRLNKKNGQVQAGSPAHKAGTRPGSDGRHSLSRHSRPGERQHGHDSLRAEITAKAAAKKTWAPGIPVFSRLWHRKPKLPPNGPPP